MTPVWYMRQAGRSQAAYRKIKEIAEITENSEDAIKKQLSRGRQELKHILER
ncbi:hypothetical protein [Prevotella histicola]|uniref:hypothetical protein n=1 Tax=Prevotella histicola TaxID=470565 RepID=UPI0036130FF0